MSHRIKLSYDINIKVRQILDYFKLLFYYVCMYNNYKFILLLIQVCLVCPAHKSCQSISNRIEFGYLLGLISSFGHWLL